MPCDSELIQNGCMALVRTCADLQAGESALVISDEGNSEIAEAVAQTARQLGGRVRHAVIPPLRFHGQEPPQDVARQMQQSDVIFALTGMSMAHSKARKQASENGARYLSLPDYSMDVLTGEALQADFRALTDEAARLAELLTAARFIGIRSESGTDFSCRVKGRKANPAPGWCWGPCTLASPPDAEVNIAPLEDSSEGVIVVDGSIPCPQIGLLKEPITLKVAGGRVQEISGRGGKVLEELFESVGSPKARVVAELGIGLNPKARLCGSMLEDEGCRGTVHLGMGSNATIGGANDVPFHLDHVLRRVTAAADGVTFMRDGKLMQE